ncbi:hypothetical protein [Rhodopila sp.]|uniref:hypothetical protein n=1 Tax=Rhodopila sp. TaxID=2480087 RepID=UPI003D11DE0C
MAFNPISWLDTARRFDRLFNLEAAHRKLIDLQADEIQDLKNRLTKLEEHVKAREEILVAEAKGAAAAVASATASQHFSDISRRLGAMEERLRGGGFTRLPSPDDAG